MPELRRWGFPDPKIYLNLSDFVKNNLIRSENIVKNEIFSHICLYIWFVLCIFTQINHINSQILVLYGYIAFFYS